MTRRTTERTTVEINHGEHEEHGVKKYMSVFPVCPVSPVVPSSPWFVRVVFAVLCLCASVVELLGQQAQTTTQPLVRLNVNYVQGMGPGYRPTAGSGLTLNLSAGTAFCSGSVVNYAGGSLTLTASATNNVYLNSSASCVPAAKTTAFSSADIPVAIINTNASVITGITDIRTMFVPAVAGGAGAGTGSCIANQFVTAVNTNPSAPTCAQPAFSGISGTATIAQGGTGQTTASGAFNALSPLSTLGDVLYGGTAGAGTRLAGNITTTKQYFTQTGTGAVSAAPAWAQGAFADLSGTASDAQLANSYSGVGSCAANNWINALTRNAAPACAQPGFSNLSGSIALGQTQLTTLGDILSVNSTPALARVAGQTSTTKNFLTQTGTGTVSALPGWGTIASSDLPAATATANGAITLAGDLGGTASSPTVVGFHFGATSTPLSSTAPTSGQFLQWNGTNIVGAASTATPAGANTQVQFNNAGAFGASANFTWTTASNLLTLGTNASATGQLGLANGGAGGAIATVQNNAATTAYNFNLPSGAGTSGQPLLSGGGGAAAMTFGTLSIGAGGTGQTTASAAFNALSPITSAGDLIIGTGINTAGRLGIGTNGQCATSNGTTVVWGSCAAGAIGGSGTTNLFSKFTGSTTIGTAQGSDDGTAVKLIQPATTSGSKTVSSLVFETVRYAEQFCATPGIQDDTCITNAITDLPAAAGNDPGGGTVILPRGATTLNAITTFPVNKPVRVVGHVGGSKLIKNFNTGVAFKMDGTLGTGSTTISSTTTASTYNPKAGDIFIQVASTAGFSSGQWIVIGDSTDVNGGCTTDIAIGTTGCNREIQQVGDVTTGFPCQAGQPCILLKGSLDNSYLCSTGGSPGCAGTSVVKGINPVFAQLEDFNISNTQTSDGFVLMDAFLTLGFRASRLRIDMGTAGIGIDVDFSKGAVISQNEIRNIDDTQGQVGGNGFFISLDGASSHAVVQGNTLYKAGMGVLLSEAAHHIVIDGNTVEGASNDAINTHGYNCRHVTISNNVISGRSRTAIALPSAATGSTAATGGSIAAGTYRIAVTYVTTAGGETLISPDASSTITTTGTTSTLTVNAPASTTGAAGYRVWVSAAGGATQSETLQTITATQCTLGSGPSFNICAFASNWTNGSLAVGAAIPAANTAAPNYDATPIRIGGGGGNELGDGDMTITANSLSHYGPSGISITPASAISSVSAPAAPTVTTATTGGSIAAGVYLVALTYKNFLGETLRSADTSITTTGSTSTITVTAPAASGNALGWNIYVSTAGGATSTETLQGVTHGPFSATVVLTSLASGAAPPTVNTTLASFSNISVSHNIFRDPVLMKNNGAAIFVSGLAATTPRGALNINVSDNVIQDIATVGGQNSWGIIGQYVDRLTFTGNSVNQTLTGGGSNANCIYVVDSLHATVTGNVATGCVNNFKISASAVGATDQVTVTGNVGDAPDPAGGGVNFSYGSTPTNVTNMLRTNNVGDATTVGGTGSVSTVASGGTAVFQEQVQATSYSTTGAGAGFTQWTTGALAAGAAGTVACGANTGNVFACSDNGGAATTLPFLAGDLGNTQASPQVNALHLTAEGQLGNQALTETYPNAATTGTFDNALAKLTGAPSTIVLTATTDTGGAVGVVVAGTSGTTGNGRVQVKGQGSCIADGATTAGDYAQISSAVGGACKDATATYPTANQVLGRWTATSAVIAVPAAATGSTAATGGTIAAGTYRIAATLVNKLGGETTISPDATSTITTTGTTSTLTINAPASATGAVGWRPWVSAAGGAANSETLQTVGTNCGTSVSLANGATACPFGTNWTVGSLVTGAAVPGSNTAGGSIGILLDPEVKAGGTAFPLLAPNGSAAAPSYSFSSAATTGVYNDTTGSGFAVAAAGAIAFEASSAGILLATNKLGFSSSQTLGADVGISRTAAGVLGVGNGALQDSTGTLKAGAVSMANMLISATAPTISSGFGTTPSIATNNGTGAFSLNVGTGGTATSGVIGLPTATNGWNVYCEDITTFSTTVFRTRQTASTTTTATVGNFNSSAVAAAWVASDILSCMAYAR